MISNTFGVGVAGAVLTAGTSHAAHGAHVAVPATAVKHRAAAATDASRGSGPYLTSPLFPVDHGPEVTRIRGHSFRGFSFSKPATWSGSPKKDSHQTRKQVSRTCRH